MSRLVAGKVLITGASSGIGAAAAAEFATEGAELFLVARREEKLEAVAETCRQQGASRVLTAVHDLSRVGEGAEVVRHCLQQLEGLDVLICNAGYGLYGPLQEIAPEAMERVWRVNFLAAYESIHEALPHLLAQRRGHILLTSSILGKKSIPYAAPYCVTKFSQVALGDALWGELRGTGVGVTVVCPGATATEYQDSVVRTGGTGQLTRTFGGQDPRVVARGMVRAVKRNRREIIFTGPGKLLTWTNRLSPGLASRIMTLVCRWERSRNHSES